MLAGFELFKPVNDRCSEFWAELGCDDDGGALIKSVGCNPLTPTVHADERRFLNLRKRDYPIGDTGVDNTLGVVVSDCFEGLP